MVNDTLTLPELITQNLSPSTVKHYETVVKTPLFQAMVGVLSTDKVMTVSQIQQALPAFSPNPNTLRAYLSIAAQIGCVQRTAQGRYSAATNEPTVKKRIPSEQIREAVDYFATTLDYTFSFATVHEKVNAHFKTTFDKKYIDTWFNELLNYGYIHKVEDRPGLYVNENNTQYRSYFRFKPFD